MEQPTNNSPTKTVNYEVFNRFQSMFYQNISEFEKYSYYEIKQNSFILLNNLIKGFPHLADELLNIYSPAIKIFDSPAIILALQRKFVNGFTRPRMPQFLYYKSKPTKVIKEKIIKIDKDLLEFGPEISKEIMSILMYDSKTYEYLKFSTKVQFLGKQILGEIQKKEEIKSRKKLK